MTMGKKEVIEKMVTPVCRFSYPSVFVPSLPMGKTDEKEAKYSVTMLFDMSDPVVAKGVQGLVEFAKTGVCGGRRQARGGYGHLAVLPGRGKCAVLRQRALVQPRLRPDMEGVRTFDARYRWQALVYVGSTARGTRRQDGQDRSTD